LFLSSIVTAEDDCIFESCNSPPTQEERKGELRIFDKTRYILGAVYTAKNRRYIDPGFYKNIPDYVSKTKRLKQDVIALEKEATQFPYLKVAVTYTRLCISSYADNATQNCREAVTILREWFFEHHLGGNWSGYPYGTEVWQGFPSK